MPMPKEKAYYSAEEIKNQTIEQAEERTKILYNLKAISMETIASWITSGKFDINDDEMLFMFEKALDRRIKPFNPPRPERTYEAVKKARESGKAAESVTVNGKSMPVAKTDQLEWMDKQLSTKERYKVAVEAKDALIASSEVLQKATFTGVADTCYKEWCVPELFDYLSMGGEKALEELRAVAYPLMVSFNHESWNGDGKNWLTPYITFSCNTGEKNNGMDTAETGSAMTFSFYLNHKREVQIMRGKIVETYYEHDFHSYSDMLKYIRERRDKYNKAHSTFTKKAYFLNIKLAEGVHAIIENDGTEGNLERRKGVPLNKTYKWNQVYDVTDCRNERGAPVPAKYWEKIPENEKQRIERVGRQAMENLDKLLFDPDKYVYRSGYVDGEFHECYGPESVDTPFLQ